MVESTHFLKALNTRPFLLYDGPMETRIQFGTSIRLNNPGSIFELMYSTEGKEALKSLYELDIEGVKKYNAPIILNAPTWRASKAHTALSGIIGSIEKINHDCISFVKNIREKYSDYKENIFITAPVGPKNTEYKPDLSFTIPRAERYHAAQAQAIAKEKVDIISIATMLGSIETIGCAKAIAATGLPYSVGVLLLGNGTMIDGTPFADVIREIDKTVSPKPNFYTISCTHPSTIAKAFSDYKPEYKRVLAVKANGSSKPPAQLMALQLPLADPPDVFAKELVAVGKKYHFKIYGGCCGTDVRHLDALAKALTNSK